MERNYLNDWQKSFLFTPVTPLIDRRSDDDLLKLLLMSLERLVWPSTYLCGASNVLNSSELSSAEMSKAAENSSMRRLTTPWKLFVSKSRSRTPVVEWTQSERLLTYGSMAQAHFRPFLEVLHRLHLKIKFSGKNFLVGMEPTTYRLFGFRDYHETTAT